MFRNYEQGVVGGGIQVIFRKYDIPFIFHIFDALRTKNPSAQLVFLFITILVLGV